MIIWKLTRASSRRMLVSLLCLLPAIDAGRLNFDNCDFSSKCMQCWDADAVNGVHPKEASNLNITSCVDPNMRFRISKGTNKIYDWESTPVGWAIHDRDEFKIKVEASIGWIDQSQFSRVAFEVQLCNIDNFVLCQPLIAPATFFEDVTTIDDVQNLQTTETPSVTRFEDLYMVWGDAIVEEKLNFGEITVPGTYRILTSLMMSDGTTVSGVSMLSDIKYLNVIDKEPMELSGDSYLAIYIISGISSAVILFLMSQTIRYRNAQVFQLTQGKFIIAMQLCALVATCSLVLFTPRDPFCMLQTPLLYLSTHMVYAILLGRMWRVRAVISPLLLLTLERKDDWTTKIVNMIGAFTHCGCGQGSQQKKIRTQITDYQLARVIMLLILPQFLIQILILTVYFGNKSVLIDAEREGVVQEIYICEYGPFYSWLHVVSIALIGLEFFFLALLMYGSRDLPSLFNETKKVWQILRGTFVFVLSGTLLIAATIDHDNTAQMRVLVPAFVLGLNMCQTCWVITWSKLGVARRGQAILVTKLIADHNFNRTNSGVEPPPPGSTKYLTHQYSGYHPSAPTPQTTQETVTEDVEEESPNHVLKESSQVEQIVADDRSTDSSVFLAESQEAVNLDESYVSTNPHFPEPSDGSFALVDTSTNTMTSATSGRTANISSFLRRRPRRGSGNSKASSLARGSAAARGSMVVRRKLVGQSVVARSGLASSTISAKSHDSVSGQRNRFSVFGSNTSMPAAVVTESVDVNPRVSHEKIKISETEAPGRRLLLRMIDVQRILAKVNTSLLTGVSLDRDDWDELRQGCVTLGEVFETEVVFAWENEEVSSIGSHSQRSLPRRPLGYRPGNQPQQVTSLPPKQRVTSTTNAGPKSRSVTFKDKQNVAKPDELLGTMLREPLATIMSIGNPIVRTQSGTIMEESESSEVDGIYDHTNAALATSSSPPANGGHTQTSNQPNGSSLAKHRVRANLNASSSPGNLSIDEVPLGKFNDIRSIESPMLTPEVSDVSIDHAPLGEPNNNKRSMETLDSEISDISIDQVAFGDLNNKGSIEPPTLVPEISNKSVTEQLDTSHLDTSDRATDMPSFDYPALGNFQKGKELPRYSGISDVSSGGGSNRDMGSFSGHGSESGHGSDPQLESDIGHDFDTGHERINSMSTLGMEDNEDESSPAIQLC